MDRAIERWKGALVAALAGAEAAAGTDRCRRGFVCQPQAVGIEEVAGMLHFAA